MDLSGTDVEDWSQRGDVQQLLANILEEPAGDHREAVSQVVGTSIVLDAHVAGVYRALDKLLDKKQQGKVFTYDGGMAFHAIMYHLQGGLDSRLRAPAPPLQRSFKGFANQPSKLRAFSGRLISRPSATQSERRSRGTTWCCCVCALTYSTDSTSSVTRHLNQRLLLTNRFDIRSTVVAAGGGGGGDPVDPAMLQRSEWHKEMAWLLECGMHPRSRASPFRAFAQEGRDVTALAIYISSSRSLDPAGYSNCMAFCALAFTSPVRAAQLVIQRSLNTGRVVANHLDNSSHHQCCAASMVATMLSRDRDILSNTLFLINGPALDLRTAAIESSHALREPAACDSLAHASDSLTMSCSQRPQVISTPNPCESNFDPVNTLKPFTPKP